MDLRSVNRFLAVAELGSLNKAASRLNLSQPALSKSIQQLEYGLGVTLIDRNPRGISLTSFGECLFEHARRISAEMRKLEADIEAIRTLSSGEINVGAPLGPDSRALAFAILRLVNESRRIAVNISNGTRNDLIQPLKLGDLDFLIAILFEPEELPREFEQTELYIDRSIVAVRAEHPLLQRDAVSLADLLDFPWVMLSGNRSTEAVLHHRIESQLEKSILRSGSPMFIKNILLRSDFVGLVRQDAVGVELETGQIAELKTTETVDMLHLLPTHKVGLIFRSDVSLSAASRALIAELKLTISALGKSSAALRGTG